MSLESRNARALGYAYPAGAEHDPSAPWNQSEPEECPVCKGERLLTCYHCKGDGQCPVCDSSGKLECDACDGTGEEHQSTREEIAEAKADEAMDREKDEPRE